MVSLGLVSLVAVALLAVAQVQVRIHCSQNSIQATQDNARAALDVLAHDARLLGAPGRGWGLINTIGGVQPVPLYRVVDGGDNDSDRLEIIVPSGEMLALRVDADPAVGRLDLARFDPDSQNNPAAAPDAARDFNVDDYVLLSNITQVAAPLPPDLLTPPRGCKGPGLVGVALLQVLGKAANALTVTMSNALTLDGCTFPRGSLVSRATATAYYLDGDLLVADDGFPIRGTVGTPAALAEHIVDLQIAVGIDGLNGHPTEGKLDEGQAANDDEWINNFPGEILDNHLPSALRITIVARTGGQDTLLGPGRPAVENRVAGEPDYYRYRVLTTTVVPRNLVQP